MDHRCALTGGTQRCDVGVVNVRGFLERGQTKTGARRQSFMLSGVFSVTGVGQIYRGYGRLEERSAAGSLPSRFSVGYYHALSKRAVLYANPGHDRQAKTGKTGYDAGLRRMF